MNDHLKVTNNADGSEIFIYDDDFWGMVSANQFRQELRAVGDNPVNIRFHSFGGSVYDGITIGNLIAEHPKATTIVDGMAASAASVSFVKGATRKMASDAALVIHNPRSGATGTASDHRSAANSLEAIRGSIIATYSNRSRLSPEEIGKMMDEETLITAQQAKEWGFTDEIIEPMHLTASISDSRLVMAPKSVIAWLQHIRGHNASNGLNTQKAFMEIPKWLAGKRNTEREDFLAALVKETGVDPDEAFEAKDQGRLKAAIEAYVTDQLAAEVKKTADMTASFNTALKNAGVDLTVEKIGELKAALEKKATSDASRQLITLSAARGIKAVATSGTEASGVKPSMTLTEKAIEWRKQHGLPLPAAN